ncbi:CdaR family protein [Sporolactobacillus vineae]|uniref:CdaR family protein n=1 Tax=Sporolactobacillus vineae TaxID=444463 RepID=UPI000289857F|nr:CdaR family protein [Sporolactobacillus vineae]
MDKLLHKNWLVKIISFLTALMLYTIVSAGQEPSPSPSSIVVNPSQQATITEKLNVKYNADKYIVGGAPKTVSIRMTGSNNVILKARLMASKSAYIDLNGMQPGTYDVRVQTAGFPSGLKIKSVPQTVQVTLQEKTSKEFPVAIDILNKQSVSKGYTVGKPEINPSTITVTGGKDAIDSVAFIKGVIDIKGADATVDRMITLHAYDSRGNQQNLTINPQSVDVVVPIAKASKQVAVQALTSGSPASGYTVKSVDVSDPNVTISAQGNNMLGGIPDSIPVTVPVGGLKKDKTFHVAVPLPAGATQISPAKVSVTVHIVPDHSGGSSSSSSSSSESSSSAVSGSTSGVSSKTFNNVPVSVKGLNNGETAKLGNGGRVSVLITGKTADLNHLSRSDISAQVNLTGLGTGNYKRSIALSVPNGLDASASPGSLDVTIS